MARPEPVPFTPSAGAAPITRGEWFRFDAEDRRDQLGERADICVGDGGACFEGVYHQIACLHYWNTTAPDFHCEMVAGVCTKAAGATPSKAR